MTVYLMNQSEYKFVNRVDELRLNHMRENIQKEIKIYEIPVVSFEEPDFNQAIADDLLQQLNEMILDPEHLPDFIKELKNSCQLPLLRFVIESSVFDDVIGVLRHNPSTNLIIALDYMICDAPTLFYESFLKGILDAVFHSFESFDIGIAHAAMKFIRKIVLLSHFSRILLYVSNFMHYFIKLIESNFPVDQLKYYVHTIFLYVALDPVYSHVGYKKIGGHISSRKFFLNMLRSVEIPAKTLFYVSHFLKYGNSHKTNPILWRILDMLITSSEPDLVFYSIAIYQILSSYSEDIARYICHQTQFLKVARLILNDSSEKMKQVIFGTLSGILYYSHDREQKKIKERCFFRDAIEAMESEEEITKIYASHFLVNHFAHFPDPKFMIRKFKHFMITVFDSFTDSTFGLKTELLWLLITIVNNSPVEYRPIVLTPNFINILFSHINEADIDLKEAILSILHELYYIYPPDFEAPNNFTDEYHSEENIFVLEELTKSTSSEIQNLASSLMERISEVQDSLE